MGTTLLGVSSNELISLFWQQYYFISLFFVFLVLTAFKRTGGARFYTLSIIFVNVAFEFYYGILREEDRLRIFGPELSTKIIIYLRSSVTGFCVITLLTSLIFGSSPTGSEGATADGPMNTRVIKSKDKKEYDLQIYRGTSNVQSLTDLTKQQKMANPHRKHLQQLFDNFSSTGTKTLKTNVYSLEFASFLDQQKQFKTYRHLFHYPKDQQGKQDVLYFTGNSLGLQPKSTAKYMQEELDKWASKGVQGHFIGDRPWWKIEDYVVKQMANIVGAKPMEVAVMNSLTVNLQLGLLAFYQPTETRYKILIEENPFPSDMHAFSTHLITRGYDPEEAILMIGPRKGETYIRTEDILDLIEREGSSIALVMLSGIQYSTGQAFEMEKITNAGHRMGCMVGFDLAHAAGNLELKLHDWGVDFACWCNYKYLNSGPGTIAGFFLHEKHAHKSVEELHRLSGWWGHRRETRFKNLNKFDPQPGAASFQLSNPPIVAMICLYASLEIFETASISFLRQKSRILTTYLETLLEMEFEQREEKPFQVITPFDPEQRGAQLSLRFNSKYKIQDVVKKLEENEVVCDEREPDIIRVSPVPLYNTFQDVYHFVRILSKIFN